VYNLHEMKSGLEVKAKRTRVPETLQCPCCGERRLAEPRCSPLADEAVLAQHERTPPWGKEGGWSVSLARLGTLIWACDACIQHGRAVRAKAWLQEYCCDSPRFAYFDQEKTCQSCGNHFIYTRAEQQRWYEVFKLPPRAETVDCRPCRAAKRAVAAANAELAARLKVLDPRNARDLAEVASLYVAIGSPRKAAEFLRRAKNVSDDPSEIAELIERLAKVETV